MQQSTSTNQQKPVKVTTLIKVFKDVIKQSSYEDIFTTYQVIFNQLLPLTQNYKYTFITNILPALKNASELNNLAYKFHNLSLMNRFNKDIFEHLVTKINNEIDSEKGNKSGFSAELNNLMKKIENELDSKSEIDSDKENELGFSAELNNLMKKIKNELDSKSEIDSEKRNKSELKQLITEFQDKLNNEPGFSAELNNLMRRIELKDLMREIELYDILQRDLLNTFLKTTPSSYDKHYSQAFTAALAYKQDGLVKHFIDHYKGKTNISTNIDFVNAAVSAFLVGNDENKVDIYLKIFLTMNAEEKSYFIKQVLPRLNNSSKVEAIIQELLQKQLEELISISNSWNQFLINSQNEQNEQYKQDDFTARNQTLFTHNM